MKLKYITGAVIIIGFLIMGAFSLKSTMSPYITIKEAKQTGSQCQIKGSVIPGSTKFNMETNLFQFTLIDDNNEELNVIYNGVKPGNFDQATYVVVMGQYKNDHFKAGQLLVKCPSKYEAEGGNS
ncbi:MAG: cytochrome c maturation protein CcmE [Calditrichia bacterium]|nr:cytochrome c maturation protein CcmE [Calditrichia bacterium]